MYRSLCGFMGVCMHLHVCAGRGCTDLCMCAHVCRSGMSGLCVLVHVWVGALAHLSRAGAALVCAGCRSQPGSSFPQTGTTTQEHATKLSLALPGSTAHAEQGSCQVIAVSDRDPTHCFTGSQASPGTWLPALWLTLDGGSVLAGSDPLSPAW